MKTQNFLLLLLVAGLSFAGAGCKKAPKATTPIFGRSGTAPIGSNPAGMDPGARLPAGEDPNAVRRTATGENPLAERPRLEDYDQDRETFKQDTVYFDLDKYNVKSAELSKVEAVAGYLKGQSGDAVLIEGHCDERGTPEYNRALGERRSLSIRESLMTLGVSGDRIHTTSYGEDKPADPGHNEAAYAKNRRGEFILLKPKAGAR
ncbi:MAG: OmpA family protein [Verrucomicrobiota bacterium]